GGDGDDRLTGGDGDDVVTGGRGLDTAHLGAGDDTFVWNPGDGSDTGEGQAGFDAMRVNGANIGEKVEVSGNGRRVRFTRDVASVVMDLNGIEVLGLRALSGADTLTVNALTGTDVDRLDVNLESAAGGGDGQADTIIFNGTQGDDVVDIMGFGA